MLSEFLSKKENRKLWGFGCTAAARSEHAIARYNSLVEDGVLTASMLESAEDVLWRVPLTLEAALVVGILRYLAMSGLAGRRTAGCTIASRAGARTRAHARARTHAHPIYDRAPPPPPVNAIAGNAKARKPSSLLPLAVRQMLATDIFTDGVLRYVDKNRAPIMSELDLEKFAVQVRGPVCEQAGT